MNHEPLTAAASSRRDPLIGKITMKGFTSFAQDICPQWQKCLRSKGKKAFDKRDTIKEKESKREVERAVKERNR
jgi:SsrA-binding protein